MSAGVILFGASKLGQLACSLLKDSRKILYFCDNDMNKWGKEIDGIKIISPQELKETKDIEIVITSAYYREISEQLIAMDIHKFSVFKFTIDPFNNKIVKRVNKVRRSYNIPFIDLGAFLHDFEEVNISDMSFMAGGSTLLDYLFLKALMLKFKFKFYLEIGTWMGESIATVSEVAEKCYSISLPDDTPLIVNYFKNVNRKNNFSRYFSYKKENIVHFFEDSKQFDFSKITDRIDLVFIDGDHSYEGICADTRNVFEVIDRNSTIVVWHDFKEIRNNFTSTTVQAIFDTLPQELHSNIFALDTNFCGVYIPEKYHTCFKLADNPDVMYSYEVSTKAKLNLLDMGKKERVNNYINSERRKKGARAIKDIKVAYILDPFSYVCFKDECQLIAFTPDDWHVVFEEEKPDMLFVESAWEGNNGAWHRKVSRYTVDERHRLEEVVDYCKSYGIPTIFWNKEDPVHFEAFIETASWFDYIFTTDVNCVNRYKERTGNPNVYPLPFAAQPSIHNPIEFMDTRENKFCFAGSYYAEKYDKRKQDLDILLEVLKKYGLVIFDRHYGQGLSQFKFPEKYEKYIIGRLDANDMYKAYKGYRYAININSVKDSPTMFSRRVFELLASNTPVVSSYSKGIEEMFGNTVITSDDESEINEKVEKLCNDQLHYDFIRLSGLRRTLEYHTYTHRMQMVLDAVGIPYKKEEKGVTVIAVIENIKQLRTIESIFNCQTLENKELILLISQEGLDNKVIFDAATVLDKRGINRIYEFVNYDQVAIIDEKNYYGCNYLKDLILATCYTQAEIIGKRTFFQLLSDDKLEIVDNNYEYKYTTKLNMDAAIFNKKLLLDQYIIECIRSKKYDFFPNSSFGEGYRLFSVDRFNFVRGENMLDEQIKALVDDACFLK